VPPLHECGVEDKSPPEVVAALHSLRATTFNHGSAVSREMRTADWALAQPIWAVVERLELKARQKRKAKLRTDLNF
jgi:hypothetical protein